MNCPVCDGVRMREVERNGVMIDICPRCKGVWLDRGELDKLLSGVREIRDDFGRWHEERYKDYERGAYSGKYADTYYKHKRKKNFLERLEDLFD